MPTTLAPEREARPGGLPAFARRHPATAFLLLVVPAGWALLTFPNVVGIPYEPFLLVLNATLLGSALLVTSWTQGPGGVRRLLGRLLLWRFRLGHYAVLLLGMPVSTFAVMTATGSAHLPADWAAFAVTYLVDVVVIGALLINAWEETAWTGFLQSRLMERHGLLAGSLLTAPGFVAVHLPLSFTPGWTWDNAVLNLALLTLAAPFMRFLLGMQYVDTRGSLLAVALTHASFNACAGLGVGWEYVAGVVVLTLVVAAVRRVAPLALATQA